MLLAALCLVASALLFKLLHGQVPVLQVVWVRSFVCLVLLLPRCKTWLASVPAAPEANACPAWSLSKSHIASLLSLRNALWALGTISFHFCLNRLPLSDAVTLSFLQPAVAAVAGWIVLHDRVGAAAAGGVLLSLLGLGLLCGGLSWGYGQVMGLMFGLLSTVLGAAVVILTRGVVGWSDLGLRQTSDVYVFELVLAAPPLALGHPAAAVWPGLEQWLLLLCIAAVSLAGHLLTARAVRLLSATKASVLHLTAVPWAFVFGTLILQEPHLPMGVSLSVAGAAFMGAGVVALTFSQAANSGVTVYAAGVR